ncbi:AAA family ATPase [Sorangium cellulosum]|uniref:AAA family ATPase n=1 Tax=Sorangium cellulosum TaxID=56 RepID=UPI0013EDFB02|nr:ATP-binding protein [Sorangium cellulosum]
MVGRNNVGKTMLLEALRLYVNGGNPASLARLLWSREELMPPRDILLSAEGESEGALLHASSLFHGAGENGTHDRSFQLADPSEPRSALTITLFWQPDDALPYLEIERFGEHERLSSGELSWPMGLSLRRRLSAWPPFLSPQGMDAAAMGRAWDALALKAGEDRVLRCLQSIAPIERVTLIQHPGRRAHRVVMVRMAGRPEPVPLKRLGDGTTRVFQLALALEMASEGVHKAEYDPHDLALDERILLADEIESGIHYSALPEVWRFLLRAARDLDVQVFAATHSWDAIEALQQAVADEPAGSAQLIRLEQRGEEHRAILFDQSELPLVTKHHVEVR